MNGTIVTFYSYTGGVGRTFALANAAVTLSQWGYRTLCVDWDLDSPGLPFYFERWTPELEGGLVDLVAELAAGRDPDPARFVVTVDADATDGRLHFLPAGVLPAAVPQEGVPPVNVDDAYVRRAQEIDWSSLYLRNNFGAVLETWRDRWKEDYDFVLVDSRTGITDMGGICTAQLPDVLVAIFTANKQSLRGVLDVVARAERARDRLPYDRFRLTTLPVPARFDAREEYRRAEQWQERFATAFEPLTRNWVAGGTDFSKLLELLTIPYVGYWSFGEELPAVEETDPTPERIGYALQTLAAVIANHLGHSDLLTTSRDSFVRSASAGTGSSAEKTHRPSATGRPEADSPPFAGHRKRDVATWPPRTPRRERGSTGTRPAAKRRDRPVLVALVLVVIAAVLAAVTVIGRPGADPEFGAGPESASPSASCVSEHLAIYGSQCIGLRKEAGPFTTGRDGEYPEDLQITEIWGKIVEANTRAERSDRPVATIIVAAQLSDADRPNQVDADALVGALLAMRAWNDAADRPPFLIRLWALNIGGDSEYVDEAAEFVRAVAGDPSVVAVTGLGQTRPASYAAIRKIGVLPGGSPGLPMVAATQSGDILTGLPRYFRIAPPDRWQAEVGMNWASTTLPGVQPFIVYAVGDTYSEGLAENYRSEAELRGIDRPDGSIGYSTEEPNAGRVLGTDAADIEARLCAAPPAADGEAAADAPRLVVFTGRTGDLPTLLGEVNRTSCARNVTVLGGDALAEIQYPPFSEIVRSQLSPEHARLVYFAFGPESDEVGENLERLGLIAGWKNFSGVYRQLNNELRDSPRRLDNPSSSTAAEYDAVALVLRAVERAYRCNAEVAADRDSCRRMSEIARAAGGARSGSGINELPDGQQVYAALRLTTGDARYQGLTGVVDFGAPADTAGAEGADPQEKLLVLHVVEADRDNDRISIEYECATAAGRTEPPTVPTCY